MIKDALYIDFEFDNSKEEILDLVCSTTYIEGEEPIEWWLYRDTSKQAQLRKYLIENKSRTICGWATVAEARSFISLLVDPIEFDWADGFLEYRCLSNQNDLLKYGKQLVEGVVKNTVKPRPKWSRSEGEAAASFKQTHSLAEATYKLIGEIRDTEHKDTMRDIILSKNPTLIENTKGRIMAYCTEDVIYLPKIFEAIFKEYKKLLGMDCVEKELIQEMHLRGEYAAFTAWMESRGYPIDVEKARNFSNSVAPLLYECQREINSLFPDIKPFKWDRLKSKFTWDQGITKKWLLNNVDVSRWTKTEAYEKEKRKLKLKKGEEVPNIEKYLSLSLEDAWSKFFDFKHSYPKESFPAQMIRYLKLKQNMSGFTPSSKKNFWDSVGSDGRVRPYFNIYGSQSSRSQPSSTSFLFLKPAWMRALCAPAKGKAIGSIDYGSEEFFISALLSRDKNMINAYLSGDVYLALGKLAGAIPKDATKESHKAMRDLFKATTLGVSYLMSAKGLSEKITSDTGKFFSEDEAQKLIDLFYNTYSDFKYYQEDLIESYSEGEILKFDDGWYMWSDNDNPRSVGNVPIQQMGAAIMRRAVQIAEKVYGLKVIVTLHDALYIEYDSFDFSAMDKLKKAMIEAFQFYFPDQKDIAGKIKLDPFTWSPDYPEVKIFKNEKGQNAIEYDSVLSPEGWEISYGDKYIDERALDEYLQFSKYFVQGPEQLL